ncbi:hypothetical protein ES705_49687 [subsurface metagenome]
MYQVEVIPLVGSSNIISFPRFTLMVDQVNGRSMILYIKPVPDIFSLAVDGDRRGIFDIIDGKRNQFLGELIGAVIIGTIRKHNGKIICMMIGPHQVV